MMINRHNYEEFFLLYADDELNNQQRAAVELFVKQNPDMAAELEMLMQMKLKPEDDIVFPDKALLFKTADVEININNYEEYFLLYIDGELGKDAAEKVEKFVLQHPKLQDDFTLLKQTVLQPEAIIFADKSALYRREERKVGYMGFARLAAAAAIIGLMLAGWWFYPKNKVAVGGDAPGVVITTPNKQTQNPKVETKQQTVTPAPIELLPNNATASVPVVKKQGKGIMRILVKKQDGTNNSQQPAPVKTTDDNNVAFNGSDNDKPGVKPVTTTSGTNVTATAGGVTPEAEPAKQLTTLPPVVNTTQIVANTTDAKTPENPSGIKTTAEVPPAQTIAYKEIDTNEDDRSMYVCSLELNKDKIKGFFKRAGRLFGPRAKKDMD